jgi:hypothetical protein
MSIVYLYHAFLTSMQIFFHLASLLECTRTSVLIIPVRFCSHGRGILQHLRNVHSRFIPRSISLTVFQPQPAIAKQPAVKARRFHGELNLWDHCPRFHRLVKSFHVALGRVLKHSTSQARLQGIALEEQRTGAQASRESDNALTRALQCACLLCPHAADGFSRVKRI